MGRCPNIRNVALWRQHGLEQHSTAVAGNVAHIGGATYDSRQNTETAVRCSSVTDGA